MKKSTNVLKGVDVCEILILGVLLKNHAKTTQDIVKSFCVNLLYLKKNFAPRDFTIEVLPFFNRNFDIFLNKVLNFTGIKDILAFI